MNCHMCNQIKTKEKDLFNCDGCRRPTCRACGNLTASEIKVLQLSSGRTLVFHCPNCLIGDSFKLLEQRIKDKDTIINDKDEIIRLLKEQIEDLKNENSSLTNFKISDKHTYSDVLKKSKEEVLIVKPKRNTQASSETKIALEDKVNPSELGVGISRVKYIADGGVAISCNNTKILRLFVQMLKKS